MSLTPEQQEMRLTGIGGSEAAAVVDCHPFYKRIDICRSKWGIAKLPKDPDAINRGNFYERPTMEWAALQWAWRIEFTGTLRHPKRPRILATPDGIVNGDTLLEIKIPGSNRLWRDEDGEPSVPVYTEIQCLQGMAVTGLRKACVVAFFDNELHRFDIEPDDGYIENIMSLEEKFFEEYIEPRVVPPPDGSKSWSDYGARCIPIRAPLEMDSSDSMRALVDGAVHARNALVEAEAANKLARQRLISAIGEREGVLCDLGNGRKWKATHRAKKSRAITDWKKLTEVCSISDDTIAEHTHRAEPYRELRIVEDKTREKKK